MEAHHHVNSPDTGKNSVGRQKKKISFTDVYHNSSRTKIIKKDKILPMYMLQCLKIAQKRHKSFGTRY